MAGGEAGVTGEDGKTFDGKTSDGKSWDARSLKAAFRTKLRGLAGRLPFAEDLLAAYYCAFDSATPMHVRGALFGALAYFILPLDALPDMVAVLGYTDDAAVLLGAMKLVSSHITPAHRKAARRVLDRMAAKG